MEKKKFVRKQGRFVLFLMLLLLFPLGALAQQKLIKGQVVDEMGAPIIGLNDSGGARIQEGVRSLAGYAEAMKAQVDSAKFVSFSSPSIAGVGYEPVLSGLAPVSENGKLVGPVKGSRGVYVFTVTDKTVSEQPFDAQTETQKIQQNYGYLINSRLMEVLRDKAEIENTMIRFF